MPLLSKRPVGEGFLAFWHREESTEQLFGQIVLSPVELDCYRKIARQPRRRKEWLTWHLMVRMFLGPDVRTDYDESGAPVLVNHPGHISVSHSLNVVVLYYQPHRCGVDVEDCGRNFDRVSDRFISQQEWKLPGASRNNRFQAVIWCLKETVYKYAAQPGLDLIRDIRVTELHTETSEAVVWLTGRPVIKLKYEFLQEHCLAYTCP